MVLVLVLDAEVGEYDDEHEQVVHAHRLLDGIRGVVLHRLGRITCDNEQQHSESQRDTYPNCGLCQGAFEGDVMRLAVDPQVGGQEHYHYDGENIP